MVIKTNRLWTLAALSIAAIGSLTSCLKEKTPSPPVYYSYFGVINAALNPNQLDLFDNDVKINPGGPVKAAGYGSAYYNRPGFHEFKFKKAGSDSLVSSIAGTYDSLTTTTLILYGKETASIRRIKNDFTGYKNDKVNFRFYNLSEDIGKVDLYLNDKKIVQDQDFSLASGTPSTFEQTDQTGSSLKVKAAGKDSLIAEINYTSGSLSQGGIYAIFLTGTRAPKNDDQKMKVGAMPYLVY